MDFLHTDKWMSIVMRKSWSISDIRCIPDYNDPVFVPLPRPWLSAICIYDCECLPSPFPGRPHLINRIVQGSSKPPSWTNTVLTLRTTVWSWITSTLENPRQPHSIPDWLSLILANVTPAHLKLWPLQGDGLQTLLGWRPSEGVAAGHMSRFLSPATLLKVERATDRRRIFVVCRHCKSRPPCHTSDHHLDILLLPSQVPQPLLMLVSVGEPH